MTIVAGNNSGFASGAYASPEQARIYMERMTTYVRKRNAAWFDRWTDRKTGDIPAGVKELANEWRVDSHLVKWAVRQGLLHPDSVKRDGVQHRQIGRLTAVLYHRDHQHRRALTLECAAYLDGLEIAAVSELHLKHPEIFDAMEGRWVVPPRDCCHDWEWLRSGGHRCRLCRGEWRPTREG